MFSHYLISMAYISLQQTVQLQSGHNLPRTERQSARMSKITNDGLMRSDTGCFIAVPILQQRASEGYIKCMLIAKYDALSEFSTRLTN